MHASFLAVLVAPRHWLRFAAACTGLLLASSMAAPAWADPPGRVGRLGDLQGQVWMYSPESGEWVTAQRNRPITTADRIATDGGARAEIQVGSTTLRLDGSTELEVLQLDDDSMHYQLHSGSVAARLRTREGAREFEMHTAEGRFRPESAGRFRFDRIDETSHVTAWRGQVLYEGPDTAVTVMSGQRAEVWKDTRTQYTLTNPAHDAFSDWVAARDQADERTASTRYVSPEMTGVEDLDRNGRWQQSQEYGPLWIPYTVAPGWAPYRYGHWIYVRPWGWTWVDDARWGFAPFHYGRWVRHRGAWCWAPGSYVARPVYAPALVAWVGGPRVSFSISVGSGPSVGWFPLGPREIYVPAYRVSPGYVRNVNVTHVTHINNVTNIINNPDTVVQRTPYVNRGPHAVTVVPSTVVMNRQPVGPSMALTADPNVARRITSAPVQSRPPIAAPAEPPRIDVHRGVPRERVRPPMSAPHPAHAPDQGLGRARVPGSSTPLVATPTPVPSATPPAPSAAPPAAAVTPQAVATPSAAPTARAAPAPPPATAVAPPPGRVWRGDEHVGSAPPRVRRGGESQPLIVPPAPAAPPVAAAPATVARPAPPPPPAEVRHPGRMPHDDRVPPHVRQEQPRPLAAVRPAAPPPPVQPPVAPVAPAQVQRAMPPPIALEQARPPGRSVRPEATGEVRGSPQPPAQARERRADQPQPKHEREGRGDDRSRRSY